MSVSNKNEYREIFHFRFSNRYIKCTKIIQSQTIELRQIQGAVATLNVKTTLNVKNSYTNGNFLH